MGALVNHCRRVAPTNCPWVGSEVRNTVVQQYLQIITCRTLHTNIRLKVFKRTSPLWIRPSESILRASDINIRYSWFWKLCISYCNWLSGYKLFIYFRQIRSFEEKAAKSKEEFGRLVWLNHVKKTVNVKFHSWLGFFFLFKRRLVETQKKLSQTEINFEK